MIVGLIATIAVACLVATVNLATTYLNRPSESEQASGAEGGAPTVASTQEVQAELDERKTTYKEVSNLFDAFLEADSVERRLSTDVSSTSLSAASGMGPEFIRRDQLDYHTRGAFTYPDSYSTRVALQEIAIDGHSFPVLAIKSKNGWKIDYEGFTGHNEDHWEDLVSGVDETVVRVSIKKSGHYIGQFENDTNWQHFILNHPTWPLALEGYARKDSEVAAILQSEDQDFSELILEETEASSSRPLQPSRPAPARRVILKISSRPGLLPRQYEITDFIAEGWWDHHQATYPIEENSKDLESDS
ncbi:hypothetical protein [Haloferula sp.]|uniref:hypothetical protein n=1 Tax=Haloferula sp. TaxID=2497595 RepID=UPI00329A7FD7